MAKTKKAPGDKTNAARILDTARVSYTLFDYDDSGEFLTGMDVAVRIDADPRSVFKTLVIIGSSGAYYVCVIPVTHELDMKKAARFFSEKKTEMIPAKDILNVTGYIKGGCSPIGMKKPYPIAIDASAKNLDFLYCSAGKRGRQMGLNPKDLISVTDAQFAELTI
jgi:Cys-tRNA(Pro)/Cys-tRNA(Cys) deacylase